MSLKNSKTLRKCEEILQPQMPEQQFLKQYCTPEKACNFIFSTETPSKNITFKKTTQISFCFFTVTSSWTNYKNWCKFLVKFLIA